MAKGKLKNKKFVDGVSFETSQASIDEILKDNESNPFKTLSLEEFEDNLKNMNMADMQVLATKVDLLPVADRRLLKERLKKQFRIYKAKHSPRPSNNPVMSVNNRDQATADEIKRIMN